MHNIQDEIFMKPFYLGFNILHVPCSECKDIVTLSRLGFSDHFYRVLSVNISSFSMLIRTVP